VVGGGRRRFGLCWELTLLDALVIAMRGVIVEVIEEKSRGWGDERAEGY
jgi:hypothetical protein